MEEQKINYTEWAVANTFKDGTIEIHKDLDLPKYKELKEKILRHELDHNFKKGFIYNLGVDLVPRVPTFQLLRFMITRPKTWIQLLPIYWQKEKGLVYDRSIIFYWTIIILFILISIKLLEFI